MNFGKCYRAVYDQKGIAKQALQQELAANPAISTGLRFVTVGRFQASDMRWHADVTTFLKYSRNKHFRNGPTAWAFP